MFSLNIYNRTTGAYCFTVTKDTRKQCLAIARNKYSEMAWDWDDKNYIKHKKYSAVPNSTARVYGLI